MILTKQRSPFKGILLTAAPFELMTQGEHQRNRYGETKIIPRIHFDAMFVLYITDFPKIQTEKCKAFNYRYVSSESQQSSLWYTECLVSDTVYILINLERALI